MPPMHAGLQLYSLRDAERSLPDLVTAVADTDLDGVELAGLPDDATVAALAATDLAVAGIHVDVETVEADPAGVAEACRAVDCEHVVIPWLDPEEFATAERARAAGERIATAREALREHGVECAYHNHDQEFAAVDGGVAFDVFLDAFDGPIELDLGWAMAGGADPAALVGRLADRLPLVHVKDVAVADTEPVDLGRGDLDVDACRRACHDAGVAWAIYEHDAPTDPMAALEDGARRLSAFRDEPGAPPGDGPK